MKLFGDRLKQMRLEKDVQQKEIALLLGITKSTMSLYEAGKVKVPPDKLQKLAEFFGTTTDYLLGKDPIKPEELTLSAHLKLEGLDDEQIEQVMNMVSTHKKLNQLEKGKSAGR